MCVKRLAARKCAVLGESTFACLCTGDFVCFLFHLLACVRVSFCFPLRFCLLSHLPARNVHTASFSCQIPKVGWTVTVRPLPLLSHYPRHGFQLANEPRHMSL